MDFLSRATTHKSHRRHFASNWTILAFSCLVMIVLYIFFPSDELLEQFRQTHTADKVTERYLFNLLETYPNNLQFKLLLAKQELAMGELQQVKALLQEITTPDTDQSIALGKRWISYGLLRTETFAEKPGSPGRQKGEQKMVEQIKGFLNEPLGRAELMELAQDSLSLDMPNIAAQYNKHIAERFPNQSLSWYADAGKTALMSEDYQESALFYFMAQRLSSDIEQHRLYFTLAIKSLLAADKPEEALKQAEKHIGHLQADKQTLTFVAELGIRANQPAVAEKYINKALLLHHLSSNKHDKKK